MSRRQYFFLLGLTLVGTSIVSAQPSADGTVPVIIRFKKSPGQGERDAVESNGGRFGRSFSLVNAVSARVTPAAKERIKRHPLVDMVEEDIRIQAHDAELDNTWGVKQIGSGIVHDSGNKGSGVKVCLLDTGIDTSHPDLYLNYKGGWDYVNNDADPSDDNSHGTHVAGTIAALMNGANVRGAAPQVDLYVYKILDAGGGGYASSIVLALQECVRIGGKVSNSSFGASSDLGSTVKAAYDAAKAAGVVNVASAGNSGAGANTVGFPGQYSSVIAVAATDSANAWASFSSTGPGVAVAAPGVSILSTYLAGGYAYKSGTSMASPHVAGVAALVVACGITNPDAVKTRLTSTALDLGDTGRDDYYGAGLVQADKAAVNCGLSTPPPPATDLAVSSVSAPSSTVVNTNISVTVNVANPGNQTASGFTLNLTDNNVFVSSQAIPSLPATGSAALTFTWSSSTTGSHTLKATLAQTDSNTANNSSSAVTQVTQAPITDLAVSSVTAPASIVVNTSSSVTVKISNTGNQTATGFSVTLSDNGVPVSTQAVPSLAASGSTTLTFGWTTSSAGSHTLKATLNPADGNAANNSSSTVTQVNSASASVISVGVNAYKIKTKRYVDVSWSGATGSSVVITRTGSSSRTITTTNDKFYTDQVSPVTYTYKVCETGAGGACSSPVTVTVLN